MTNQIPGSLLNYLRSHPDIVEHEDKFQGCCPLHGGDGKTSFVVYKDSGVYICFSHQCQEAHGNGPVNLCRALDIEVSDDYQGRVKGSYKRTTERTQQIICSRQKFISRLDEFPSKYALSRGFPSYLLKKYCIGSCFKKGKFYNRTCCPIFSDNYEQVVGITGRANNDDWKPKWYHHGFKTSHNIFNIWFAKSHIRTTKKVIIVEGIFDVLRLEQAGIKNSVAVFGLGLGDLQEKVFQKLGVQTIVFGFDRDEAGEVSIERLKKKYELYYNFERVLPPKKDWGECSVEEIEQALKPVV